MSAPLLDAGRSWLARRGGLRMPLFPRPVALALGAILAALILAPAVSLLTSELAGDRRSTLREELRPFVDEVHHLQVTLFELVAEANRLAFGGDLLSRQRYNAFRTALVEQSLRTQGSAAAVGLADQAAAVVRQAEVVAATLDEGVAAAEAGNAERAEQLLVRVVPVLTVDFAEDASALRNLGVRRIAALSEEIERIELIERVALVAAAIVGLLGAVVIARTVRSRERLQRETERARDRAEHQRQRFNSMVAATDLGVLQVDAFDRIEYVNPAAARLLGYTEAALAGRFLHATLHRPGNDGPPCDGDECALLGVGVSPAAYAGVEHLVPSDGESVPVEVRTAPIRIDEATAGAVVVFQDITERLLREQMQEDFLSLSSHELRSPLTSVMGYAARLRRKARSDGERFDPETRDEVETLHAAAARMARTVDLFLDLARLEAGRFTLDSTPFDLPSALDEEVDTLLSRHRHVRVLREVPEGEVLVAADEDRVREVATNLLENAAKYAGEQPEVTISLRREGRMAAVSVRDNGPGIPPEDRPRLFQRFYRGSVGEGSARSLGVGLYICKQMVDLMGGDIDFECPPEGGTVFTFRVPLAEPAAPEAEPVRAGEPASEAV
jgi:PAS domain S-box-containing protein